MGDYLSTPICEKEFEDGECKQVFVLYYSLNMLAVGCKVGGTIWKMPMFALNPQMMVYPYSEYLMDMEVIQIYYVGQEVALYVKKHLPEAVKSSYAFKSKNYKQALIDGFLNIDKQLESTKAKEELKEYLRAGPRKDCTSEGMDENMIAHMMGCTACVALITQTEIYVANAGDSRAVLSRKGHSYNMSEDHKPELERERKRIEKANGFIEDGRVNGALNLSRCLGDLEYKQNKELRQEDQIISGCPEIHSEKLTIDMDFLIIACDGIWDCLTSQQAVNYLKAELKKPGKTGKLSSIIGKMLDSILAKDVQSSDGIGCDNMTCMVILFKRKK